MSGRRMRNSLKFQVTELLNISVLVDMVFLCTVLVTI